VAQLHLILARARNGVIGNRGALPWHLPEDLAHFKRTTMGHAVVMGRKTWDSIGRPLPGRLNLVVTRDPQWKAPGAQAATSLAAAVEMAEAHLRRQAPNSNGPQPKVFVIGGAQLYALALLGEVAAIYLTQLDADFPGDTYFPDLDPTRWREGSREHFEPSGERRFGFDFVRYDAIAPSAPSAS
jgi:dihydrofolate reductase